MATDWTKDHTKSWSFVPLQIKQSNIKIDSLSNSEKDKQWSSISSLLSTPFSSSYICISSASNLLISFKKAESWSTKKH